MLAATFTCCFLFSDPAPPEIYTLSLHDALPICRPARARPRRLRLLRAQGRRRLSKWYCPHRRPAGFPRSEEHTSELQSHHDLVCRLLLEKKKNNKQSDLPPHPRAPPHPATLILS